MTKRFVFSLLLCFSLFPIAYSQDYTLQLKWRHQFQFAGIYAAIEKGYFEEAGLNISLRPWSPGVFVDEELLSGEVDFAIGNSRLLINYSQGEPVVALATIFQRNPWILLTSSASGIQDPWDLPGRRVMYGGDTIELILLLKQFKLSLDDVVTVPQGFGLEPLRKGRIDVLSAYYTDAPFLLDQEGFDYHVISPDDYYIPSIGDTLYTTKSLLEQSPQEVIAFTQAVIRGWEYALDNPDELIDLIIRQYDNTLDRELLEFEAQATRTAISPQDFEIGELDPYRWASLAQRYEELGLASDIDLDGFLFQARIYQEESQRTYWLIFVFVGIVLLVLIPVLAYPRIQKGKAAVAQALPDQLMEDLVLDKYRHVFLGKLIAPITHDLNTPLGIALTAQSNILERLKDISQNGSLGGKDNEYCQENLEALEQLSILLQENITKSIEIVGSYKRTAAVEDQKQEIFLVELLEDIKRTYQKRLSRINVLLSWQTDATIQVMLVPQIFATLLMALLEYSISRFDPVSGPYTVGLNVENSLTAIAFTYQDNGLYAETVPWDRLREGKAIEDIPFLLENPIQFTIDYCLRKLGYTYKFESGSTGFRMDLFLPLSE